MHNGEQKRKTGVLDRETLGHSQEKNPLGGEKHEKKNCKTGEKRK